MWIICIWDGFTCDNSNENEKMRFKFTTMSEKRQIFIWRKLKVQFRNIFFIYLEDLWWQTFRMRHETCSFCSVDCPRSDLNWLHWPWTTFPQKTSRLEIPMMLGVCISNTLWSRSFFQRHNNANTAIEERTLRAFAAIAGKPISNESVISFHYKYAMKISARGNSSVKLKTKQIESAAISIFDEKSIQAIPALDSLYFFCSADVFPIYFI